MSVGQRNPDVLIIGAGVASMEAGLLLSKAGRRVHIVEKSSFTGGTTVLFEQVYPDLECATCMLSPRQQDLLQDPNIDLLTLAEVEHVETVPDGFIVTVRRRARSIDPIACIGCGACYEPCPVSAPNEAEQGLSSRKAVFVPFPGALPNVPMIDRELCLHFQGKECQACKEACMFDAVNFDQQDEKTELKVGAIVVATGSEIGPLSSLTGYGYGRIQDVYHALEIERLFASNGPTGGKVLLRNGRPPRSVALVHCAGREVKGYCSAVCCMYLLKFNHYLRANDPGIEIHEYYTDMTIPGQGSQHFFKRTMEGGTDLVRRRDLTVEERAGRPVVVCSDDDGCSCQQQVDMVILAPPLQPQEGSSHLAEVLGIALGPKGYYAEGGSGPVSSSRDGIFIIGGARGPMDIGAAVADAGAAAARVLNPARG